MSKKWLWILTAGFLLSTVILGYKLYQTSELLETEQTASYVSVEKHVINLSDSANQAFKQWDTGDSRQLYLLKSYLNDHGVLLNIPATDFYDTGIRETHTASFSTFTTLLSNYNSAVESDLNKMIEGARTPNLKEKLKTIVNDIEYLRKNVTAENLKDLSSAEEFHQFWINLADELQYPGFNFVFSE